MKIRSIIAEIVVVDVVFVFVCVFALIVVVVFGPKNLTSEFGENH